MNVRGGSTILRASGIPKNYSLSYWKSYVFETTAVCSNDLGDYNLVRKKKLKSICSEEKVHSLTRAFNFNLGCVTECSLGTMGFVRKSFT